MTSNAHEETALTACVKNARASSAPPPPQSASLQAIKPRSLELRDELAEARREFEQAVAAEARRRRQQRARLGRPAAGPSRAGPGSVAAPVAGGDGNTHGSTSSSSGNGSGDTRREEARCIGEELAAADLPGLAYRFEQVRSRGGQAARIGSRGDRRESGHTGDTPGSRYPPTLRP